MTAATPEDVTRLLDEWSQGNPAALEELMPLVYGELHRLAEGAMRGERSGHTILLRFHTTTRESGLDRTAPPLIRPSDPGSGKTSLPGLPHASPPAHGPGGSVIGMELAQELRKPGVRFRRPAKANRRQKGNDMSYKKVILGLAVTCCMTAPLAADWSSGVTAFKAGDLSTAEAEFRALTETQPDWAGGHLMLGQTLLRAGRVQEALRSLERARELAPDDLQAALALGQAYVNLERYSDAAGTLRDLDPEALPEPQKVAFYRTRALAAIRSGRQAAAIPDLENALELMPDDELHRLLAQAAREAGSTELAVTHFGRALELDPEDVTSLRSLVQLLYDRALDAASEERADLCQTVLPHAERLVELESSYEHLVLFAEAARCVGSDREALDLLEMAAAERPGEWWPQHALGRTWVRLESWSEAEAAFLRALELNVPAEEEPAVRKQLGYAYERQERLEEALAQYRLAGDDEGAERVEKNLIAQKEEEILEKLADEKKRIEKELEELEESGGGGIFR